MHKQHIKNIISDKICSHCGLEAEGWKCPKCGTTPERYDPLHWQKCTGAGKLQARCKECGQAESKCTCKI